MKTINVRDLQKKIRQCVDLAQREHVVVTRHGRPAAVVIGVEGKDWEDVFFQTNASFWKMIQDRRTETTTSNGRVWPSKGADAIRRVSLPRGDDLSYRRRPDSLCYWRSTAQHENLDLHPRSNSSRSEPAWSSTLAGSLPSRMATRPGFQRGFSPGSKRATGLSASQLRRSAKRQS